MTTRKKKQPKPVGVGRLKKKVVKAPPGDHPYKVRFGTRNELGEARSYPTAPKAKQAIVKELNDLKPWCERYNQAGLIAIGEALLATDEMVFHVAPARLECCFDEHTQMYLVAEYWHK